MDTLARPLDLERARAETPGCKYLIHLNNARSALMPQPVLDAVVQHLQNEALLGGYAAAALLSARANEIAIVENATRAWDMAFYSVPFAPGDRIVTAQAEYASNYLAFLQVARRTGAVVAAIPVSNTHR